MVLDRNNNGILPAFTLIELLVVIAVIGMLLAIITPALHKAKQAAMTVICQSNLRAYGQVGNLYLDDNDQFFPDSQRTIFNSVDDFCQWHDASRSPEKMPEFAGVLIPYLSGQKEINLCPVFEQAAKLYGADHINHDSRIPIEPQYGYSMNAYLSVTHDNQRPSAANDYKTLRFNEVRSPARTFFFSEENLWIAKTEEGTPISRVPLNDNSLFAIWENGPRVDAPLNFGPENGDTFQDSFATFHKTRLGIEQRDQGVAVAVFLDAHVEIVHWQDTWRYSKTK